MWSKFNDGTNYEVRSAGRTLRLYTNGVFHSQFNPERTVDGGLWNLLSLPALLLPPLHRPRVLILGVGGGAVMRQLAVLLDRPQMVGVDLDAVHLKIARRWFGITERMASLVCADAVDWLQAYKGPGFDLVIDDLFGEHEGEPVRAVSLDAQWGESLERVMNPSGLLIVNSLDCKTLRTRGFLSRVRTRYRCQHPQYENCVGVFNTGAGNQRQWRQCVTQHPRLKAAEKRQALLLQMSRL